MWGAKVSKVYTQTRPEWTNMEQMFTIQDDFYSTAGMTTASEASKLTSEVRGFI